VSDAFPDQPHWLFLQSAVQLARNIVGGAFRLQPMEARIAVLVENI